MGHVFVRTSHSADVFEAASIPSCLRSVEALNKILGHYCVDTKEVLVFLLRGKSESATTKMGSERGVLPTSRLVQLFLCTSTTSTSLNLST